jgi:acetylornithine/N-succinyldiaminopimelate aminotransferase
MNIFDVYPLFDITPVKGEGAYVFDESGNKYLDFYGGHAVISIGHSHPHYVEAVSKQLTQLAFYSNSVKIPQQQLLADKLGKVSGYYDYALFLCNSGAEANENAFHGRTSLAVAATDDKKLQAPINENESIIFLPLNDIEALEKNINNEICAVIIEGIQGVGGIHVPDSAFLKKLRELCTHFEVALILDEIQSGYGRSGHFFAHQVSGIKADIITVAKGMGNGFPVAGVLISPEFEAKHGMLGTTFGGNYLACAAAISVLEVIEKEKLIDNAEKEGSYILEQLKKYSSIKDLRGMGLMIGIEFDFPVATLRNELLQTYKIFTGSASNKNTLRLLPPLTITRNETNYFLNSLHQYLTQSGLA